MGASLRISQSDSIGVSAFSLRIPWGVSEKVFAKVSEQVLEKVSEQVLEEDSLENFLSYSLIRRDPQQGSPGDSLK